MGTELNDRRTYTTERIEALKKELKKSADLAKDKACVYATGSFARGEASEFSDLDLFIVGKSEQPNEGKCGVPKRLLGRLDEICIKANLIGVTRKMKIPDFSGDGQYLQHYTVEELTDTLGHPKDDAANTFTARLLLLLESLPLVGKPVYDEAVSKVIEKYWRDFDAHRKDFMPAFLANDILRIWRTFCVNYEAQTTEDPPEKKAKRKLKNYKLKHSRLLTCYSALLYLLAEYTRAGTVTKEAAIKMTTLTPTQRIEQLGNSFDDTTRKTCTELIDLYEQFLRETKASEHDLIEKFLDQTRSQALFAQASAFGDKVFELLHQVGARGNNQKFYRLLIV